jgi:uncharacterized membrane protein
MSYQEKKSIVNLISSLLISAIYAIIIYQKHVAGQFDLLNDYVAWGKVFLVFIGISAAAKIIINIIFNIINAIATRTEDLPITDERDKLIELKSGRNAYIVFVIGFALSFASLAIGFSPAEMFICLFAFGALAEIIDSTSQIYHYRKGV